MPEQDRIPEILVKEPRGPPDVRHQIVVYHELHREERRCVVSVKVGRLTRPSALSLVQNGDPKRQTSGIGEEVDRRKYVRLRGSNADGPVVFGIWLFITSFGGRNGCPWRRARGFSASPGAWPSVSVGG